MAARGNAKFVLLMLSGALLVIAGLMQLLSFFPLSGLGLLKALGIAFVLSGIIFLALGFLRVKIGGSALLLAASLCALLMISSGVATILTPGKLKAHVEEITTADVGSVSELVLSCDTGLGSIELYSTSNRSSLVLAEFYLSPGEKPVFEYEVADGKLSVLVKASSSPIKLFVADWLPWTLGAETSFGSVKACLNATFLRSLSVETSLGSIELAIEAEYLAHNCTINAWTGLGSVELRLAVGPSVGAEVRASTSLGSIGRELEGFEVISSGWNYLLIRSEGYEGAERFMAASVGTSLGSVEVRAERRT